MWIIIALIIVGILLLVAELVLLPGLSVAGVCCLISYGVSIYLAFSGYGATAGYIVIAVIIALSIVATMVALKARTWERFSLKNQVDGTSQAMPEQNNIKIGDFGLTLTRLAPMGKVLIAQQTFEAKSIDAYIDPKTEIEVIGFENFNIIVKQLTK